MPAAAAFASAVAGATTATILGVGEATDAAAGATASHSLLREYLPLIDTRGNTDAIAAVWRDAGPIVGAIEDTQGQLLIVTLAAAAIAALVLWLVFRAAHVRIARQTVALLEATRRDPLTGMLNHGALVAELTESLDRARTAGTAMGVALIDLDNFRLLNDTHGHAAGDSALLRLGSTIDRHSPRATTTGRYGPDEFLVIAPAASIAALRPALEQLRHAPSDESLQFEASERLPITISAGIATSPATPTRRPSCSPSPPESLGEARASGGDAVRVAGQGPARTGDARRSRPAVARVHDRHQGPLHQAPLRGRRALRGLPRSRLELDASLIEVLRVAGLLHDIGKVGIPEDDPAQAGTAHGRRIRRGQAARRPGRAIVRDLVRHDLVRLGIRHHHERWDGDGYLDGLAGRRSRWSPGSSPWATRSRR